MSETTIDVKALRTAEWARSKGNRKGRITARTRDAGMIRLRRRISDQVENREFRLALSEV